MHLPLDLSDLPLFGKVDGSGADGLEGKAGGPCASLALRIGLM